MNETLYCDEPDCDRPVAGHGRGKCSTHLKQLQRTGKCAPIAPRLTPEQRAQEAGIAMLEADGDEEYSRAHRAWISACKALGMKERIEAIRRSLADARGRGVRIGRPPKVSTERVLELVQLLKKPALVAQVLGVHRDTVYWHLARCRKKDGFPTPAQHGPRLTG